MKFSYIKAIQAKGPIKLRKIFTTRFPLSHFDVEDNTAVEEEQSVAQKTKLLLPKDLDIPLDTYNTQVDYTFVTHHSMNK